MDRRIEAIYVCGSLGSRAVLVERQVGWQMKISLFNMKVSKSCNLTSKAHIFLMF